MSQIAAIIPMPVTTNAMAGSSGMPLSNATIALSKKLVEGASLTVRERFGLKI
jgi:hypothetical protein